MNEYQEKQFSEIFDELKDVKTYLLVESKIKELKEQRGKAITETNALNGAITILKSMIKKRNGSSK